MNSGFTTWPERQFEWEKMEGPTNSLNHPMHSGFAAYFYESLGGIKSSKEHVGYKEFTVNPIYPNNMTETTVKIPSPYGDIHNSWNLNGEIFSMKLEVPFNTKSEVLITSSELESLKINGESVKNFQKNNVIEIKEGAVFLGSGNYIIEYTKL